LAYSTLMWTVSCASLLQYAAYLIFYWFHLASSGPDSQLQNRAWILLIESCIAGASKNVTIKLLDQYRFSFSSFKKNPFYCKILCWYYSYFSGIKWMYRFSIGWVSVSHYISGQWFTLRPRNKMHMTSLVRSLCFFQIVKKYLYVLSLK
jgi:hypothetical protein